MSASLYVETEELSEIEISLAEAVDAVSELSCVSADADIGTEINNTVPSRKEKAPLRIFRESEKSYVIIKCTS